MSMIYNNLAKYYDALLKDDEAVLMWTNFFDKHHYNETVLELGAGTGEITLELAKTYTVDATDLSNQMLDKIKEKDIDNNLNDIFYLDMNDFNVKEKYDNIICFCDSINYLETDEQLYALFNSVYASLNDNGVFMFDMHTNDRLEEFKEPFIETGQLLGTDYQWSITTDENKIYHHFVFYEDDMLQEYHTQTVFDSSLVLKQLQDIGFNVKVYTDFVNDGITEGEKLFIVGEKV